MKVSNALWLVRRWWATSAIATARREARRQAFEAAIARQATAEGVTDRIAATDAAIASPAFYVRFHAALASLQPGEKPKDENAIRAIALGVLEEMGVDTRDVHFTVFWAGPEGNEVEGLRPNELRFSDCSLDPFARARIAEAIASGA